MNIAVTYVRSKQAIYVKECLQRAILEVIGQEDLDLEVDPVAVSLLKLIMRRNSDFDSVTS
jgi:hypothetical protein